MFLFGFGRLIYISVLLINAVAILSEDRFLARVGWGSTQQDTGFGARDNPESVKARGVKLISSIRMLTRVPLIAVNTFIILYELVLG